MCDLDVVLAARRCFLSRQYHELRDDCVFVKIHVGEWNAELWKDDADELGVLRIVVEKLAGGAIVCSVPAFKHFKISKPPLQVQNGH